MSRPRFFVPYAGAGSPAISLPAEEAHHLLHVLRLGPDAEIAVFDGRGGEWAARVASVDKRARVAIELGGRVEPVPEPVVRTTLGIGLLKGDHMDAVVRDATMLGVAAIAPFVSARVVVPARARRPAPARWRRVAVASAKQCGRAVVPEIAPVAPLGAVLERSGADRRLIFVEPALVAGAVTPLQELPEPPSVLVLIGPEGGWSRDEVQFARGRGAVPVSLGPRRLRADAAPIVALSALGTVWGW